MLNKEVGSKGIIHLTIYALRTMGIILFMSPFFLYWFVNGDSDRYQWLISGPYPFSSLGSGPFQLLIYIVIIVVALILTVSSIIVSRVSRKHNKL